MPWLVVGVLALLSGAIATGELEARVGTIPAFLLVAALAGGTFLVLFSFLGSLAILAWPVATTIGYLLQVPRNQPVITFDRVWIGGLLAYIALNRRTAERSPFTTPLAFGMLLLTALFGLRAVSTSTTLGGPMATWINAILLPTILYFGCDRFALVSAKRGRSLMGALSIAGGVLGAIGIAQRIWGFELASVTGGTVRFDSVVEQTRISGPYPVPEVYALSLLVCLAATLYWIRSRAAGERYVWAVALVAVQITAVGLTLFRAAWIAAAVVVVASLGFHPGRQGRLLAVVGLTALLALVTSPFLLQSSTIATRAQDTENIYGRLATYRQAGEIFRSAPLFGVGVNRYRAVAAERPPESVAGVEALGSPHNSYTGLLAEQGILGFLPLLAVTYGVWILIRGLRLASLSSREAFVLTGAVAGGALGYLVMSLTLTMLPYGPSNAFFAAFLGVASGRLDAIVNATERSARPAWQLHRSVSAEEQRIGPI